MLSGRQDSNLRPIAAATALIDGIELVTATPTLIIDFFLNGFSTCLEVRAMNQMPRSTVLGCF